MKKAKHHTIETGLNQPTDIVVSSILMEMTGKRLNELAKLHGSQVKRVKSDTAIALARVINAPGRNLTATITLKFI